MPSISFWLVVFSISLGSANAASDGPEIFLSRYLATGMEESFLVACPAGKAGCQIRGTGDKATAQTFPIARAKVDSLVSGFHARVGELVSEKKAEKLPDPGHETAAVVWRVKSGGPGAKLSQGVLEREEPKDAPAKAKYEKKRKALLNLEADLQAIADAHAAKAAPKKK